MKAPFAIQGNLKLVGIRLFLEVFHYALQELPTRWSIDTDFIQISLQCLQIKSGLGWSVGAVD